MKPLPPEVWGIIVGQLPREDQKICLGLSKLHHDFALKALFSHVYVYFGLWIFERDEDTAQLDAKLVESAVKTNMTWDLLRHISLSPGFAKIVKTLTVLAYATGGGDGIFHTRALTDALPAMSNIRAFRWYGDMPQLSCRVLTALAQSSETSLEELHIPITDAAIRCLSAFPRIRKLRLINDGNADATIGQEHSHAVLTAIDSMSSTLTQIAVQGDVLWGCSIQSMLGLQELELILPWTARGLALVFRHCLSLRSLTLFPVAFRDELFPELAAAPTALPELRALKFIYLYVYDEFELKHAEILAEFIKNKKKLVSLNVEIEPRHPIPHHRPLLEAASALPCLKVLGFNVSLSLWERGDIRFFEQCIPRGVTALRVSADIILSDNEVFLEEWFNFIRSCASLRYFHVFDTHRTLDLKQQILEDPPASLELLGYGPFLRRLVRDHGDPDEDRPKYSPCWSTSKLKFRTAEDFGCAEWEWLLRWHDCYEIDEYST